MKPNLKSRQKSGNVGPQSQTQDFNRKSDLERPVKEVVEQHSEDSQDILDSGIEENWWKKHRSSCTYLLPPNTKLGMQQESDRQSYYGTEGNIKEMNVKEMLQYRNEIININEGLIFEIEKVKTYV